MIGFPRQSERNYYQLRGLSIFFEGSRIDPPQEVGFFFETCDFGKILCHKDGESVLFSTELISGCDLGEYGEQNPVSLSDEPFFESFIGKKLDLALMACFSDERKIAGVCFCFAGGNRLIVLNLGDEIFFNEIPVDIFCQENMVLVEVGKPTPPYESVD